MCGMLCKSTNKQLQVVERDLNSAREERIIEEEFSDLNEKKYQEMKI